MEIVIWAQLILFSGLVLFNMYEDFSGSELPPAESASAAEDASSSIASMSI